MNYTDVHSHSDNYKWSVGASTGAVCPCGVKTCYHTDLMYVWNDYTHHYKNCICGIHELQPHIISRSEYLENKSYYTCLICDGPASSGFIQRELDNGDLLLSNGVIVQNDTESSND